VGGGDSLRWGVRWGFKAANPGDGVGGVGLGATWFQSAQTRTLGISRLGCDLQTYS